MAASGASGDIDEPVFRHARKFQRPFRVCQARPGKVSSDHGTDTGQDRRNQRRCEVFRLFSYNLQRRPLPDLGEVPVNRQFRLRIETHGLCEVSRECVN